MNIEIFECIDFLHTFNSHDLFFSIQFIRSRPNRFILESNEDMLCFLLDFCFVLDSLKCGRTTKKITHSSHIICHNYLFCSLVFFFLISVTEVSPMGSHMASGLRMGDYCHKTPHTVWKHMSLWKKKKKNMRKVLCAQHAVQGARPSLRRGRQLWTGESEPLRWPRSSIQGHFPYHFIRAIGAAE